jgi:hypothetical protein
MTQQAKPSEIPVPKRGVFHKLGKALKTAGSKTLETVVAIAFSGRFGS